MNAHERLNVPALFMTAGRALNLGLGFVMVPLLIRQLGGEGFTAWALLLSCSAVFSVLDVGIPTAFRREAAVALRSGDGAGLGRLISTAVMAVTPIYAVLTPLVIVQAPWLAHWLKLSDGEVLSASGSIVFVFLTVALRSILRLGFDLLYAAGDFRAVGILATTQAFLSNAAATAAASLSGRLDIALVCFWSAQLAIAAVGVWVAHRRLPVRPRFSRVGPASARRFLRFGIKVQFQDWAQAVNFQFDKFVILSHVGLGAVLVYEVANRTVLALRSLPAAGMDTFLPGAAVKAPDREALRVWYSRTVRLAAYSVALFVIAPLAVAPVFLSAWVGEIGHASRWAFTALAFGTAANLLAFPSATLLQAMDKAGLQARASLVSMLLNVPLSLCLVRLWGVDGAAIGTAIAMASAAVLLVRDAHRALGVACSTTVREIGKQMWPVYAVGLAFGATVHVGLSSGSYSRGPEGFYLSGLLYLGCVCSMLAANIASSGRRGSVERPSAGWRGAAQTVLRVLAPAH
jgi:O-antigen/teichoic acid export membrane protein